MRIAIVDDVAQERAQLRAWLLGQFSRRGMEMTTVEFENGQDFLDQARQEPFSAAFLDIDMTGATGMECARLLREFDSRCQLIFTTTSTDHALEGFRVRAMDYLVKPYTEDQIDRLTQELLQRLPAPEKFIEIKVGGSPVRLQLRDMLYAEHFSHIIHIHTAAGQELATRQSFGQFIQELDGRFFVCGRGLAVNLDRARDFDGLCFAMEDGSRIPVSRELQKKAKQVFLERLLERGHL